MAQITDPTKPVSLRDAVPASPPVTVAEMPKSRLVVYIVLTAIIFLLAGLLIATLIAGGGDSGVTQAELRDTVEEVVGTQIAAVQPVAAGPDGGMNRDELQQMINQEVNTQVAALIPTNTPIPPTPTRLPPGVADDDDAFLGPEDAPVVIVEFSDFQCGYCGRFYEETLPKIREAYPEEVKFVYRDFPIFGDDSVRAGMAAECADEQGKFWDMHNRLFEIHNSQTQVTLSQETLVSFAEELDLDTEAFDECLTSERYLEEVMTDYQTAVAYGFRGTPGFVINGVVYSMGAQPFEVFKGIIDSELAS